jgi:hypothetical protein
MVVKPSPSHLTHDELGTPSQLREDCAAVGRNLRLDRAARAAVAEAPSLEYDAYPREVAKRDIRVSDAAARCSTTIDRIRWRV